MKVHSVVSAVAALLIGGLAVSPAEAAPETYAIDGVHSSIVFRIRHMDIGYVYGRFDEMEGTIVVDDADLAKASVQVTVKATSVNRGNAKRDDHLRSPDFFAVAQFPTITFKSTSVKKAGETSYEVAGDLTLHGTTKPVKLKMERTGSGKDPMGSFRIGFEGTLEIKRTDYGMDKMLPGAGDDVRLLLAFEGVRK